MAGEAKIKQATRKDPVLFDFSAIRAPLSRGEREMYKECKAGLESDDLAVVAVKQTILVLANAAFPQGMKSKRDQDVWANWQDAIDGITDDPNVFASPVVTVTREMADWLFKHADDEEKAAMPPTFARLRRALTAYLLDLKARPDDVSSEQQEAK